MSYIICGVMKKEIQDIDKIVNANSALCKPRVPIIVI